MDARHGFKKSKFLTFRKDLSGLDFISQLLSAVLVKVLNRMLIGNRWRQLREEKQLSHTDLEKRTGLSGRCISDVEIGRAIRSLE